MKKVIKVKLDPQSISNAVEELEQYKKDLERRVRFLLEELTYHGADIAKANVVKHGVVHDANLTNSISGFVMGNQGFIRVDDEHAVFFEFGTGPVGAKKPHPLDAVNYRTKPWYTRADGKPMDELYGWKPLEGEDGDVYYLTFGQPSKPFMYDTAQKLKEEFPEIVGRVFK